MFGLKIFVQTFRRVPPVLPVQLLPPWSSAIKKMMIKGEIIDNHIAWKVTFLWLNFSDRHSTAFHRLFQIKFVQNLCMDKRYEIWGEGKDGFSFSKPVIAGTNESSADSTLSIVIKCSLWLHSFLVKSGESSASKWICAQFYLCCNPSYTSGGLTDTIKRGSFQTLRCCWMIR